MNKIDSELRSPVSISTSFASFFLCTIEKSLSLSGSSMISIGAITNSVLNTFRPLCLHFSAHHRNRLSGSNMICIASFPNSGPRPRFRHLCLLFLRTIEFAIGIDDGVNLDRFRTQVPSPDSDLFVSIFLHTIEFAIAYRDRIWYALDRFRTQVPVPISTSLPPFFYARSKSLSGSMMV